MEKEIFTIDQMEDQVRKAIGLVQSANPEYVEEFTKRLRINKKVDVCTQAGAYTVMEQAANELSSINDWDSAKISLSKMNAGLENIDDVSIINSISRLCVVIGDQVEQRNKENVQSLSKTLAEITARSGEFWRERCEARGY